MTEAKYKIPFVKLIKEGSLEDPFYSLFGNIKLTSWANFNMNSTYIKEKKDNLYDLSIGGDMVVDNPTVNEQHLNAYNFILQNENLIKDKILQSLFSEYQILRGDNSFNDDEDEQSMPNVKEKNEFSNLIELSQVHILNVSKDNIAYFGFQFNCKWDEEHGLGILFHKERVVKIGGSDVSFLTWLAEKDLDETSNQKWWKFW